MIEQSQIIASLRSVLCPGCGKAKKSRQLFCYVCFMALPAGRRSALYKLVGEGYEEAVEEALKSLSIQNPHWPRK
jgi:hypothetical protein